MQQVPKDTGGGEEAPAGPLQCWRDVVRAVSPDVHGGDLGDVVADAPAAAGPEEHFLQPAALLLVLPHHVDGAAVAPALGQRVLADTVRHRRELVR